MISSAGCFRLFKRKTHRKAKPNYTQGAEFQACATFSPSFRSIVWGSCVFGWGLGACRRSGGVTGRR